MFSDFYQSPMRLQAQCIEKVLVSYTLHLFERDHPLTVPFQMTSPPLRNHPKLFVAEIEVRVESPQEKYPNLFRDETKGTRCLACLSDHTLQLHSVALSDLVGRYNRQMTWH
jgi:hypothetical protein